MMRTIVNGAQSLSGAPLNLKSAQLQGAVLRFADLSAADLEGADLERRCHCSTFLQQSGAEGLRQ
jgi:uncharacterized protein YjbI with pentapeptide repeats